MRAMSSGGTGSRTVDALVFGRVDFCLYNMAKDVLKNPTPKKVLERSAENHRVTVSKYNYGRKQIQKAGIYPFAFLKKGSGVEVLPNPLKLILGKLAAIGAMEECV